MMRLKHEIEKTTHANPDVVTKAIVEVLESKKYRVLDLSNNTIEFDRYGTLFRWSWDPAKLRMGSFKLNYTGESLDVKLTYYVSFTKAIIMMVIMGIITVVNRDYSALYFAALIAACSFIEYINHRIKAKALINDVLSLSA